MAQDAAPHDSPAAPLDAREATAAPSGRPEAASTGPRLEVAIYQVTDDGSFLKNRKDGQGWDYSWAEPRRGWMDATSQKFAYRCLPLTIVNQTGLWVRNPVGFTATWRKDDPNKVDFVFDGGTEAWKTWITNHFGSGIITWNSPFLFRTKPAGSRILVTGPPNMFKENCQPLTGLVETDWASMTFTMNWKILEAGRPVRFERGEPVFHVIPLARNPCLDIEQSDVVYRKIEDDPAVARSYREWFEARNRFHELQKTGQVAADSWQKHYFRGVTLDGKDAPTEHYTRINPPEIRDEAGKPLPEGVSGALMAPPLSIESRLFAGKAEGARAKHEARTGAREAIVEGKAPAPAASAGAARDEPAAAAAPAPAPREPREPARPLPKPPAALAPAGHAGGPAPDAHAPPGVEAQPPGGWKLKSYRLHPRAARLAPAVIGGRRLGFHLYAPADLDAIWYGGASFDWKLLSPFGDEDADTLATLAARSSAAGPAGEPVHTAGVTGRGAPPKRGIADVGSAAVQAARKLDFGGAGEGVVSLWTGLLLETPPGWAVEVRPALGADAGTILAAEPAILETDTAPRELTLALKFRATDRWARLRAGGGQPASASLSGGLAPSRTDPEEARPIAHLLPIRRESFDADWISSSFPIEASKNAVDVWRRWRAGRDAD